jgi:Lipocalin-like domain
MESAAEVFDGGERRDEFGPSPEGYLCYNPADIVSATLGDSARPPARPATLKAPPTTTTKKSRGASSPTSDRSPSILTTRPSPHYVDVSLFPNWQGHDQARRVSIDDGR